MDCRDVLRRFDTVITLVLKWNYISLGRISIARNSAFLGEGTIMKKTVMFTETRTWFFELDLTEEADLVETMRALKDTNGFYFYLDDCTSDEYESSWQVVPEDWCGGEDPDYTEDFRAIAERELKGDSRKAVLSSLVDPKQ